MLAELVPLMLAAAAAGCWVLAVMVLQARRAELGGLAVAVEAELATRAFMSGAQAALGSSFTASTSKDQS